MMSDRPAFVFVHGAWHSGATWEKVAPLLEKSGHAVFAPDLPGAGANAAQPDALGRTPFDPAGFAAEPSPNAGVTQEERTAAIVSTVRQAAGEGNGKVVLVGHSLGGLTISPVAEAVPELIHSVVYLTAFMLPPGMPAIAMIQHELMAAALVPDLFMADPQQVGALRINTRSQDPDYREKLKQAFYGDVDDEDISAFARTLHSDEPVSVAVVPSAITQERFGTVPRVYIRCLGDRAITPEGQAFMIKAVDEAMGHSTTVHELNASHSPFLSMPEALAEVLETISG